MEVLQKIPELKDNGEKIVRPSSRVSRAPALRMKPATEGVHACTACMFSFESAELLALHTRGHDAAAVEEGGATACPGCQEECGSMTALIAHVAEHRKAYRPRQQCPDCGLYVSVKFFDQHIKTLHPEKSDDPAATFTCGECKKEFGAQKQLWAHEQIHRSKSCLFCAQLFPSWRHLSQHVAQHKQSEGFPCLHCAKTCDSYAVLSRHCRAQHDAKAVCICEICGAIKRNHGALRHHMLNHANTFRHPCDLCGKGFKTTTTLRTHQRWKHSTELKEKHKQHKQKQSGVPRDYLNPRQRMRFEEFKFRCEECRFGFLTEGRWLRHKEKFHYEE
ncbi:zinc finger protein 2-like [Paramacrobiotus metropolitanus]|uniref:zinc finger protein 2-like n=1 Tax=Paramacrobiotus metropolitanus TaxID=2943436 RepID=UPI002445C03A|nr:zinc finger protein 2-like [Paramacrobiotus metropolitanus]